MNHRAIGRKLIAAAACVAVVACDDATAPDTVDYLIQIDDGNDQFAAPTDTLADPFEVLVTDAGGNPIEGLPIVWRVTQGSGANVLAPVTRTDSTGVATTFARLGGDLGTYTFAAFTDPLFGRGVAFRATGVNLPVIESIQPATAGAGDTIRILGRHFGESAASTLVLFGGFRGEVIGASPTRIDVRVPSCIPTRTVAVTIRNNGVAGSPGVLQVTGDGRSPLDLAEGDVRRLAAGALDCIELPRPSTSARYLLVLQNADSVPDRDMNFQLAGLVAEAGPTFASGGAFEAASGRSPGLPHLRFENQLRRRERRISPAKLIRPSPDRPDMRPLAARSTTVQVGDTRRFSVFNKNQEFSKITARVELVSEHAIFYQDVNAPADGFTPADFEAFGELFDNVIYDTDVGVFGMPSDVDDNGRIIILFTPVVNALTARGSDGFVAGFFFGFDLTTAQNSNEAEIFYTLVPDPEGAFSDRRTVALLQNTIPPVLSHEFQHMIAFNQRKRLDPNPLWLAEGLAHMAEDLVGDSLVARGDFERAFAFKASNLARAHRFLENPSATSLVGATPPGTLELRGAGWLFVDYLMGHYGGTNLLGRLVQTTNEGVAAVEAETREDWELLLSQWSVALWADGPADAGVLAVDPIYTFATMDLYGELSRWLDPSQFPANPLDPERIQRMDVIRSGELFSSSARYLILDSGQSPYSLTFTGRYGGEFAAAGVPQLTILRF